MMGIGDIMQSKIKKRNRIFTYIMNNDPERFRQRIALPIKGKGRKDLPRKKQWLKNIDSY